MPISAFTCLSSQVPEMTLDKAFFVGLDGFESSASAFISAGQRAGQAIGIPHDLPGRATTSHQKTLRATSFGHALGTVRSRERAPRHRISPSYRRGPALAPSQPRAPLDRGDSRPTPSGRSGWSGCADAAADLTTLRTGFRREGSEQGGGDR